MKTTFLLLILFTFSLTLYPQGYYIDPTPLHLPDATVTLEPYELPIPFNKEDVRAIGMGKTQIANGKTFNAMMYNPALLSRGNFSFEAATIQLSMPPETYDAARFIQNHLGEFRDALSLQNLWAGINEYKAAQNLQEQFDAVKKIRQALIFPRDLLKNVIGTPQDPKMHGIRIIPSISAQAGNFGFTLYGIGQSGFQVQQSPVVDALLDVPIPDNLNDPNMQETINKIQLLLQAVVDESSNIMAEAMPVTYSISYIDIVGAAGYGFKVTPDFSLGANLKVINRRFSAKRVVTVDYNDILNVLKRDLNSNQTGFTMDLGAKYRFNFGLELGLSLQNIIPVQKITSTVDIKTAVSYYDYERDQNGEIILTQQGDTVIQSVSRNINVNMPFDLKTPIIANIGLLYPIFPEWDIAFDWVDLAAQDVRFNKYYERLRIGTEYRLDAITGSLGTAFRIGMADGKFAGGLGINLFNVAHIDGAYAWDNFVEAYSWFLQLKLGWY